MSHIAKDAEVATGVSLPYVEQGDPSGVPVLLLHGLGDSWRSFETVIPHMPDSIRAIAVTLRGHGEASRPETGYGIRDFSDDIASFMDRLQLEFVESVGR